MNERETLPAEAPPATAGYRPPPRYRTIKAAQGTAFDGAGSATHPLEATIRSNLTGGELDWLKAAKDKGEDVLLARLAPLVVAWNVEASVYDPETDQIRWEALPPPAEGGPEVLARADLWTRAWLFIQCVNAPLSLGEDAAKASALSPGRRDGGPSETPPSGNAAPSPTPSPSSRAKRSTSSPTPGDST